MDEQLLDRAGTERIARGDDDGESGLPQTAARSSRPWSSCRFRSLRRRGSCTAWAGGARTWSTRSNGGLVRIPRTDPSRLCLTAALDVDAPPQLASRRAPCEGPCGSSRSPGARRPTEGGRSRGRRGRRRPWPRPWTLRRPLGERGPSPEVPPDGAEVEGLRPLPPPQASAPSTARLNRRPHDLDGPSTGAWRVIESKRWENRSIRASSSSIWPSSSLRASSIRVSRSARISLALRTLHLGDDPGAEADEDLPRPGDRPAQVGLPADRDEELAFGTRPPRGPRGFRGPVGGRRRRGEVLVLLEQRVELVSVRLEAHQVLLDLLLGRGRAALTRRPRSTDSTRIRDPLTPWHPPISESAHSFAWAEVGASQSW